jgi:hypothetical protein
MLIHRQMENDLMLRRHRKSFGCCTVKLGTRPRGGTERSAASANKLGTHPKGGTERSERELNGGSTLGPAGRPSAIIAPEV